MVRRLLFLFFAILEQGLWMCFYEVLNIFFLISLSVCMFPILWINQICNIHLKGATSELGYMNVILLHNNHRHVSDSHATFFRLVRTVKEIQIQCVEITPQFQTAEWFLQIVFEFVLLLFSPRCRWPLEWPEHAGDNHVIKLHS